MSSAPATTKLLGLGMCLLAVAACSAEASSPAPKDHDNQSNGNTGGKAINVAGNAPASSGNANNPGTGGTGNSNGTAGSSPMGSSGSGTTGGTAAGGSPGGALAACPAPPAAGTMTDLVIDDAEDHDNGLTKIGGRTGFWYTFGDAIGTAITPKPDPAGTLPLVPGMTDCHGASKGCIIVSGSVAMDDANAATNGKYAYAGVGFDFSNAKKPCHYNASAYAGIKFWARGDAEITVKVNTPATADASGGGTCAADCGNAHGTKVILTPAWAEYDLPFATIAPDPTWGPMPPPAFDKANVLSVQVQFPPGSTFSAALDDFTFY